MNATALAVLGLDYVLIMSLPFVFFEKRDRRRSAMWWVAAAPFILLPVSLAVTGVGVVPAALAADTAAGSWLSIASVVPAVLSVGLVASALASHSRPLPQWHQDEDRPRHLVDNGPYARVRHPFYLAYLLMFLAAAMVAPSVPVVGALVYAAVVLGCTAAREERRLCASAMGDAYRAYMARTGRFLPRARRPLRLGGDVRTPVE
jgi:protein-S-isoprenylcysteine O-methyltransferase Ste14